ncbi:MAG TPA: prolyl oligopeptidase family serine peptidase [Thermoanaerobaculia bacterium]|nr:prolyl oligopeptidase family serine peptidase [Thermoanaerobaculia bacterium]
MRRTLCAAALTLFTLALFAQQPQRLELTVDTIMRGPGLSGYAPRNVRWSRDGQLVYFDWKQYNDPTEETFDTYVAGRDGKGLRKLSDAEANDAPPGANGNWTRDRKRAVYVEDGDVFLYDAVAKKRRALTDTNDSEADARFTRDEKRVTFVRGNNLYVLSLNDGSLVQLTNIVSGDEKGPHVSLFEEAMKDATASQKWIAEEAKKLSDVVARRSAEREEEEAKRKAAIALAPMKLKKGESISDLELTPDETFVIAFISVDASEGKRTIVPSYVTDTGYTTDLPARRKVGDAQGASRVVSISVADGKVLPLKHGLKRIEPAKDEAAKTKETTTEATAQKTETKEPPERDIEIDALFWSDDGTKAVLPARALDNKDSWLLAFDPATGNARVLHHEHDDAWVQWYQNDWFGFLPNSDTVYFLSEKTGWLQLYAVPYTGGDARALTSGKYEVQEVELSPDRRNFFLTTSRESLHELHFYRMNFDGSAMTRLTKEPGWHNVTVSPDGTLLADVYSYSNKPQELYVSAAGAALTARVTTSPAPEFNDYPWLDVPIVYVPARDGAQVPARIYKPENWKAGGPAVLFVHGAGYLQNVHRAWSSYSREYMFHHLLRDRGYLVLDLDYRAGAGYGRDWRTAIYRHMGGVDLEDHVDAAKWLVSTHGVDAKHIGIYGGSYGGFITLMAMFTTPDVFAAGAALRPVTDWAHYNHPYTSNILNNPQDDPEAHRKSSPIYFAEGLKGALLICHGVIDVNVHFQDTVRLAQRLIELRKENWEVAMYPLEDHTFVEPTSWADEYKRILKLFETNLR